METLTSDGPGTQHRQGKRSREDTRPVVTLDQVSREFGRLQALAPLDLEVGVGRVLGLLGPNGAGKTTLMSIMACELAPSTGEVTVGGTLVTDTSAARRARRRLALMPQRPASVPGFSALDTVEYAAWAKGLPTRGRREPCMNALDRVGLAAQAKRPLRTLSGGMVQRVHLAAALVSRPALLLLDEPTVGLDPAQRIAFRALVEELEDTATVLATHLVEDVRALSDEIMVLDAGQVRFRGTTAESEARATSDAPGDNQLERGYMSVLSQEQS
ncbi:multidrug ABC transporter ATP-binding protein [Actinomyces ruminis]|uniref:Multidrug ABC transporter ATP-binding protein n=1 Tax=Actinomyces ruminis TaxID=1937003 RepID=A0ABX4MD28_9ACTO|nr:multidrug ABC transporter ATP-binding protein [Actinomyces ruminis]